MNTKKTITKEKIKIELSLFLEKLGFDIKEIQIDLLFDNKNDKNTFLIKTNLIIDSPEILIGEGGDTLLKLQHILKIVLRKKLLLIDTFFYFNLDINNYKYKKEEKLRELIKIIISDIILTKEEKLLEIMSSYERRIVHIMVQENETLITETVGIQNRKRILIKLKDKN